MRKSTVLYVALGIMSCIYVALTFLAPTQRAADTYHISALQLHLLQLTIVIPMIVIWAVALWGSLRFKTYAQSIISSKDGKALNHTATGLLILVFGLVISTTFSAAQTSLRGTPLFDDWVVAGNYIDVASVLIAFIVIFRGARQLAALVKFKGLAQVQTITVALLGAMGSIYGWMMAMNPYRQSAPDAAQAIPYFLPDWMLIATIVIPYLVAWYLGLIAALYVQMYQRYSPGIIYRKAAKYLSRGLLAVVFSSVLIQGLGAMGPSLRHLGLTGILFLVYILILVYGAGHMLVAAGAKRLAKLEEVA